MTQRVLGFSHWDYESLRKWSRRLQRGTVKPWEIVNLWRAKVGGGWNPSKVLSTFTN